MELVKSILTAQVYAVAKQTPLEKAPRLSKALGNEVFLKREDLQSVFSFKVRGAFNKIARLDAKERELLLDLRRAGQGGDDRVCAVCRLARARRQRRAQQGPVRRCVEARARVRNADCAVAEPDLPAPGVGTAV